jgi:hypothetical protein
MATIKDANARAQQKPHIDPEREHYDDNCIKEVDNDPVRLDEIFDMDEAELDLDEIKENFDWFGHALFDMFMEKIDEKLM